MSKARSFSLFFLSISAVSICLYVLLKDQDQLLTDAFDSVNSIATATEANASEDHEIAIINPIISNKNHNGIEDKQPVGSYKKKKHKKTNTQSFEVRRYVSHEALNKVVLRSQVTPAEKVAGDQMNEPFENKIENDVYQSPHYVVKPEAKRLQEEQIFVYDENDKWVKQLSGKEAAISLNIVPQKDENCETYECPFLKYKSSDISILGIVMRSNNIEYSKSIKGEVRTGGMLEGTPALYVE
ncbi:MAG: hypothetical protein R3B45_16120 [Bdellovibrionota bacterium]